MKPTKIPAEPFDTSRLGLNLALILMIIGGLLILFIRCSDDSPCPVYPDKASLIDAFVELKGTWELTMITPSYGGLIKECACGLTPEWGSKKEEKFLTWVSPNYLHYHPNFKLKFEALYARNCVVGIFQQWEDDSKGNRYLRNYKISIRMDDETNFTGDMFVSSDSTRGGGYMRYIDHIKLFGAKR